MKRVFFSAILSLSFIFSSSSGFTAKSKKIPLNAKMNPNGHFSVSIWQDGTWKEKATVKFDQFYRTQTTNLGKSSGEFSKIKISRVNGGAGHIDLALLNGSKPLNIENLSDKQLGIKKLSKKDYDVVDICKRGIVVSYKTKEENISLKLHARIEAEKIGKIPFIFPPSNKSATNEVVYLAAFFLANIALNKSISCSI